MEAHTAQAMGPCPHLSARKHLDTRLSISKDLLSNSPNVASNQSCFDISRLRSFKRPWNSSRVAHAAGTSLDHILAIPGLPGKPFNLLRARRGHRLRPHHVNDFRFDSSSQIHMLRTRRRDTSIILDPCAICALARGRLLMSNCACPSYQVPRANCGVSTCIIDFLRE